MRTARRLVPLAALAFAAAACQPAAARPARDATLRVLVLNMHAGRDAAGEDNLARVAALVREHDVDLALLQEVDSLTARSGGQDQAALLAATAGRHATFGSALAFQGGGYGVAILSRMPAASRRLVRLPVLPPQRRANGTTEPRGLLHVEVATGGGSLAVLDTHLDASREATYRAQEAALVADQALALAATGRPVLVGGDFNSEPGDTVQRLLAARGLRDLWPGCGEGSGLTFPAAGPVKRIDYLYGVGAVRCVRAEVVRSDASDHLGVLFELRVGAR